MVAALALSGQSRGDTVTLKNGTVYQGQIVEETPRHIKIKARVNNIVSTLTVKRAEIATVVRGEVPADLLLPAGKPAKTAAPAPPDKHETPAAGKDDDEPGAESAPAGASGEGTYFLIPISGVIGEEVHASGLEAALDQALRGKVRHVVLELDTPGGLVAEANALVDAMAAFRTKAAERKLDVTIHGYIRSAISAGIWIVTSCDRVWLDADGVVGAAVIFRQNRSTGNAEVDAKLNSATAATLASAAQTHGLNGDVVRAMVVAEAELYAWPDGSGGMSVRASAPAPKPDGLELIDSQSTVLTLRADQADRLGFGELTPGGPEAIGAALGIEGWSPARASGAGAMEAASRQHQNRQAEAHRKLAEAQEILRDTDDVIKTIDMLIGVAQSKDPRQGRYFYDRATGRFTPDSQREWQNKTDASIAAWNDVVAGFKKLDAMRKRYKTLTGRELLAKTQARMAASAVNDILAELRKDRNRSSPP